MFGVRLGAGFGSLLLLLACGSPAPPPAAQATPAASSSPAPGGLSDQIVNKATFSAVTVDPNATAAGQPVVHYSFHQSIPSDSEADSQMWLARDTCRPVQAASTWTTTAAGGSSRGESTINWSK